MAKILKYLSLQIREYYPVVYFMLRVVNRNSHKSNN